MYKKSVELKVSRSEAGLALQSVKKWSFLFALVFIKQFGFAQDTTLVFYFKSGQSKLNPKQTAVLDQLKTKAISKISLEGYADTVGKMKPNLRLSQLRAEGLAQSFGTYHPEIHGFGESREKKIPLSKMRKVVVRVWFEKKVSPKIRVEEKTEVATEHISLKKPCSGDTTIRNESGSLLVMNTCEFLKIKDCFRYREFTTARSVQEAGLRTVDENNSPIESGGMFEIRLCSDSCLKKPLTIFLPVPPCLTGEEMSLWLINTQNRWQNSKSKLELVKIDNRQFYKVQVYCPGKYNADRRGYGYGKVIVKIPRGLKIKEATLSYDCPLSSTNGRLIRHRRIACFSTSYFESNAMLDLKAYDRHGDTLLIEHQNINGFKLRRFACGCYIRKESGRFLGFRRRLTKYKIRRKDVKVIGLNHRT